MALGLGLVAVAFTVLNALLFRVDAVPDVHEMFAVERPQTSDGERQRFTRAQFDALRRETNVFTDAYAELPDVDSRVDGRLMFGTFVTGNFFQVLGVSAAMGRALTPADDEPSAGQPVMVLSHRGWDRLFARDPAILGRRLLVNGVTFEIVGVMPEGFRGLTVAPDDYWAPLSMLGHVRPIHRGREANVGLDIIGRLKPGLSRQTARAELAVWDTRQSNRQSGSSAARSNITLVPRRGTVPQPREAVAVVAPLFFAFGLILLIGCANVANLLLARAVARQREIGIQLSLGATRRRIVRQLLTESLLLALVAAAAGFAISRAGARGDHQRGDDQHGRRSRRYPIVGTRRGLARAAVSHRGAGVSTIVFGLAPALHATRIEPIRTIRGEVVRDARPGRARNVLIGLQVSASALLLICAAVFLRSAFAAATFDPGVRTSDTVVVQIVNEPTRNAIVQAVTAEPSVAAVAASWPEPHPERRSRKPAAQRQRSPTSSYRRSTSACSISRSCGGGRSRRPSARRIFRWPSFPKQPRAPCGRMPMRSARSCASTRIPRPNAARRLVRRSAGRESRRSSRERSRWSGLSETSPGSGSHPSKRPSSTCRRVPRCPGRRSSRASTAIPNWHGRRSSID